MATNKDIEKYKDMLDFKSACASNNIFQLNYIFYKSSSFWKSTNSNVDNIYFFEDCLTDACEYGYIEIIKWLIEKKPECNISVNNDKPFRNACEHGHITIAKYLVENFFGINISADSEYAFRWACANGHIEIVKWLFQIKNTININALNDEAFRCACENYHIDIIKWLLELDPSMNMKKSWSYANDFFCFLCREGELELAKKLFNDCDNIDIKYKNYYAYKYAHANNHTNIINWMLSEAKFDLTEYKNLILK